MRLKLIANNLLALSAFFSLISCASTPSFDARAAYTDCTYQYESIVDVNRCAEGRMRTFEQQYGAGTVYNRGTDTLQFFKGLVNKVETKQISNDEAWNRFNSYTQQKAELDEIRAQQDYDAIYGSLRLLNCQLYGDTCDYN